MATRHNRLFTLLSRRTNCNAGPWGYQVGHPCGFIATTRHLRARPSLSKAVGDMLLDDATMSGDFEDMLMMMKVYKLSLSKRVKLHLKQWVKAGCPTWRENEALSRALVKLYTGGFGEMTTYQTRDASAELWEAAR